MRALRPFVSLLAAAALAGCVAGIPAETRERLDAVAVVGLLGDDVRHVDREWWRETYFEEVCTYDTYNRRRFRRCWLEPRTRTMSRVLGVHVAPLTGGDVDAAAVAVFRDRVAQAAVVVRVVPADFGELPFGAVAAPPAEDGALAPAVVERLRAIAQKTGAHGVVVLQGECAGPAGGCWAASVERSRQAGPYGGFSPWAPSGRFHAWLFDPAKGAIVSRWSAPETKFVRAGWGQQAPPPAIAGSLGGALDPAAAQAAAQAIRYAMAELADDFACAMTGGGACERSTAPPPPAAAP
ncbi:MAG: hypothetical protein JNK67_23175 [Alphaproteobacteria bacterium]|nr:hypothetical protein [Alphaproteobacteria bacterium]